MPSNVETLKAAHAAFNRRDWEAATQDMVSNMTFVDHASGERANSAEDFLSWLQELVRTSSDTRIEEPRYIDAGEHVVAQFVSAGTNDGPLGPFEATGRPMSVDVCQVWHFNADGKMDMGHSYSDQLHVLVQVGRIRKASKLAQLERVV